MGVLHGGGDHRRERAVLGVNVGHPIVANGDFVAQLFSAVRSGDAALPKLLWDFLLLFSLSLSLQSSAVKQVLDILMDILSWEIAEVVSHCLPRGL